MKSQDLQLCESLLKEHGYRVTPGRVSLLMYLKHAGKPLTATEIQKGIKSAIDKVTLYRALEDFVTSKIVGKVSLQSNAMYYEFLNEDHHHHHIVCDTCGKIEDIEYCGESTLERDILKSSKDFTMINSHAIEFFGTCRKCAQ